MAMHSAGNLNHKAPVLTSWKEIAGYMGRGVRTAQRYEREFQLPVRRLPGKSRGAVIAIAEDIDAWLRYGSNRGRNTGPGTRSAELVTASTHTRTKSAGLRLQSETLRNAHHEEMMQLRVKVEALLQTLGSLGTTA
jgi:hypothetical protein